MSDIFLTPSHLTTFITPVPQDFARWRSFVDIWTFWMRRSISTYLSTLFLLAKSIRPLHLYFTIMNSQFLSLADISNLVLFDKEIDGKYVGSRPIKLRKSNWKDRNVEHVSWMVFFFPVAFVVFPCLNCPSWRRLVINKFNKINLRDIV